MTRRAQLRLWAVVAAAAISLLAGCDNMKDQRNVRREEPSALLPRGTSAQLPPPNTVPHQAELPDAVFTTGERNGQLVDDIPMKLTPELLARGRDRYTIYCAVCHGPDGYGDGIVVRRGFPRPPSYHDPRLRNAPIGHFFRVATRGYGMMYPYADRLSPDDRWAVAAYIRALQLSQNARAQDLPESDRQRLSSR